MVIKISIKKKIASSNEPQTLPKQAEQDHTKPLDTSNQPSGYHPFIDKLSIVVTPLSEDAGDIFNNVWAQFAEKDVFQDAKAKWGPFKVAKWINLEKTNARALFQLAYVDKQVTKCRLEFNPRKVGQAGLMELKADLTSIFNNGWEYVIEHGVVTRIDVAVDMPNARPGMFAILPQQGLTSKSWAVSGKLQTFVLGKKKGNQTLLYNKKLERLSKGQPWIGKSVARLERRLRHPPIVGLNGLHMLPNPFKAILLTEIPTNHPPGEAKPWVWEMFKDCVIQRGLPGALALLPKEKRTLYRDHLKNHPHQLWDPVAIWKNWPAVVKQSELGLP
jgi:hypothetical protein